MEQVMLQTQWGWPIALYLFLGGLGAGTLLVTALVDLKFQALAKTVKWGAWAGVACLVVGTLLLLVDVTMPFRAIVLWQSFSNLGSWMAIGAWLLGIGIILGGVWALANTFGKLAGLRKPFRIIVMVLGVCIAAYTGILLSVLAAHPLWNTPLLPVLFLVSAVDTGVALTVVIAAVFDKADPAREAVVALLEKATLVLVAAEAVVLVALLALVGTGSETGAVSVGILTTGTLAVPFWVLFVAVGLVVPAAVALVAAKGGKLAAAAPADAEGAEAAAKGEGAEAAADASKKKAPLGLIGAVCCLVGGCALRFLILMAGIPVWM